MASDVFPVGRCKLSNYVDETAHGAGTFSRGDAANWQSTIRELFWRLAGQGGAQNGPGGTQSGPLFDSGGVDSRSKIV